ncbi:hypothetical protein IL306_014031, partial [Fusarium sp. DS 682]
MERTKSNEGVGDTVSHASAKHNYDQKSGAHSESQESDTVDTRDTKNYVNMARRRISPAISQPKIKGARRASYFIDDEIEEDSTGASGSENQQESTKRKFTDDMFEITDNPPTPEAIDISGHPFKKTCNMLGESDISPQQPNESNVLVPSTLSQEDEGENSIPFGLADIVKLSLSLGTIDKLKKELSDAETHVEEAEAAIAQAKLTEC